MNKEELLTIIQECFVDVTDAGLTLQFRVIDTTVVQRLKSGKIGSSYKDMSALKRKSGAATHYYPSIQFDILAYREKGITKAKFSKWAAKYEPMLEYAMEKVLLNIGDYELNKTYTKPIFKLSYEALNNYYQGFYFTCINYGELYEYLPAQSRLVSK
jgi:hypothetical protein